MSEEGEGTEEVRIVVVSEKEGNTPVLCREGIMESVVSTEEEVKLHTPVPSHHIITSDLSSPTFLPQVSNPDPKIILVSEKDGIEAKKDGVTETVLWDKVGNLPSSAVVGIRYCITLKDLNRWYFLRC